MRATDNLRNRLDDLRRQPPYTTYRRVLDWVLQLKDSPNHHVDPTVTPSDYWAEELANFEYMFDASPLIIDKLRHHCYHITGLRVYDYRTNRDSSAAQLQTKLNALIEVGGSDLLVPESRTLGGFGHNLNGELYNVDTLKFFESMIALRKSGVLEGLELRMADRRPVIWEIGAGWGGLAYQFKTLLPNTTYVISDFPELFLFSAVYLQTLFPEARVLLVGENGHSPDAADWRNADFVFVPNSLLHEMDLTPVDLTINTVSFQEMTTAQVRDYIARALDFSCPLIYSLNRDRSLYNKQLTSVRECLDEFYASQEVEVLPVQYTQMLKPPKPSSAAPDQPASEASTEESGSATTQAPTEQADQQQADQPRATPLKAPKPKKPKPPKAEGPELPYRHLVGVRRD
jgi:hypothetical protein